MPAFNQEHLKKFRFKQLFNDLGWDLPAQQQPYSVAVGDDTWLLDVMAHKRGVQVLHCRPDAQGHLPDYATRQKIERKVTPDVREHLIVFTDAAQTVQVWQWVAREKGKTAQYREVHFRKGEAPELLTQKLSRLHFALDEEEMLTVLGVTQRMDDATPRDKVTKKFYTDFERQRKAFAAFIEGIPDTDEDLRWYTAVVIDRLMFLWFLQEKSFLDGKKDYLQSRLTTHLDGAHTASFYKRFLTPLFFRGFAQERSPANRAAIKAEFGDVPYLNGGLFAPHELEQRYGEALDIKDAAFSKLFSFFDEWEWHLDERPLKSGKEINPDVLGYIFEKFVNQKQMGAYYTKEDITDYIGKNTIIPCLLAKVRAEHPGAFDALAWPLIQQSGDAYIYPAMLKGVDAAYPPDIANGLDTEAPELLARRKPWNKRADEAVSLPTEIWRETIARHQRTREVRAKLAAGELKDVGDLITWNLDIRQFAQDLIERCTDVALLKSFWFALAGRLPRKSNEKFRHGLSVLDPTCGSGAFLFAALNILKPLYDATLRTLQAVRTDALIADEKSSPEKWAEVDELLARFAAAGSDRAQDYAVIKHIIVNNLYGVDIEKQATEIAKLRLFLKLVSLLEPGDAIEPLPDIDFNIRHGNTLVGYATADETEKAVKGATQGNLFSDAWEDIRIRLCSVEEQYNQFQIQQVQRGGHVSPADKQALVDTLAELEEMLNYHLAREYGINTTVVSDYEAWKVKHQPFHWYVDFYPLMASGGFDVVIGNPPYKDLKSGGATDVKGYETFPTKNLYPLCFERSLEIGRKDARIGLIVPVSSISTDGYKSLQALVFKRNAYLSSFDDRPSRLFDGLEHIQLTIHLLENRVVDFPKIYVTNCKRWSAIERINLFPTLNYVFPPKHHLPNTIPKIGSDLEKQLWIQVSKMTFPMAVSYGQGDVATVNYSRKVHNFLQVIDFIPEVYGADGNLRPPTELKRLNFPTRELAALSLCLLNSSLFRWYIQIFTDCRHVNKREVDNFPFTNDSTDEVGSHWLGLSSALSESLRANSEFRSMKFSHDHLRVQCIIPKRSKSIIDEIEFALGKYFCLTSEQLDFVVNYDIKYRMGSGMESNND